MQGRSQLLERKLQRGASADEVLKGASEVVARARRAVWLSDAVLDVARMQTGGLTLQHSTFDLHALTAQWVADIRTVALQHCFELTPSAPVLFEGDERRMGQVLRNLIDNAVKYVPAESGPIELSVERDAAASDATIVIEIRDHGPGVTDVDLPHLFERKYRSAAAQSGPRSGSGLGLYITRQVVEAHGGRIWAEHAPGGLLVRVILPAA